SRAFVHGGGQFARWALRLIHEHLAPEPVDEFSDRGELAIRRIKPLNAHGDGSTAGGIEHQRDFAVPPFRRSVRHTAPEAPSPNPARLGPVVGRNAGYAMQNSFPSGSCITM